MRPCFISFLRSGLGKAILPFRANFRFISKTTAIPTPLPCSRSNYRRFLECFKTKLDIFLDLSDPQSAKAWPTLKRAVQDSEDTMEFVFHAIPLVADPIAVDYAKVSSPALFA